MEEMSDVEEVDSSDEEVDEDLHSESESVPEVSSSEDEDSDDLDDVSDSSE